MAWELTPITGALQYFDDAGVAIGDVRGGQLVIDPNVQIESAIGGQASAQGAVIATTVNVDVLEPVLAYVTGMPRSTNATQSTSYDFECGTAGGDYNLTKVQPAGFSYEFDALAGGIPRVNLQYWAALVAEAAVGSAQAASAGLTDCSTDFVVTVDGVNRLAGPCAFRLNTNPFWFRSATSKATNQKRFPDSVMLGNDEWSCDLSLAVKLPVSGSAMLLDDIDQGIEVIATGQGIAFTLSNLCSPAETMPFEGPGGLVWYRYSFRSIPGAGKGQVGAAG